MCVILHAKKKIHMRRPEICEAMDRNSSGFYMAALSVAGDGKPVRKSVRTMDQKQLLDFFDNIVKDDDEVVMHARIPSYGTKGLENVHGWEVDGIQFCHNMSIRSIDGFRDLFPDWKDKTDSQFFFEKLFIPYYRGLGTEAFKDGKFHPDLDRFVKWICGMMNKFCFVMPDNTVLRYGSWVSETDRKHEGEIAFYASNTTYKVYKSAWPVVSSPAPVKKGGTAAAAATFSASASKSRKQFGFGVDYGNPYDPPYGYDPYGYDPYEYADDVPNECDGTTVRKHIGLKDLAKAALTDMVLSNATALRDLELEELRLPNYFSHIVPDLWDYEIQTKMEEQICACSKGTFLSVLDMLVDYSCELEDAIMQTTKTTIYLTERDCKRAFDQYVEEQTVLMHALNLTIDFEKTTAASAVVMYSMAESRTGAPIMKKVPLVDLITPEGATLEMSSKAVETILLFTQTDEDEIEKQIKQEGAK